MEYEFERSYDMDASLIFRQKAIGELNAHRYFAAFFNSVKALAINPLRLKNVFFPFYLPYLTARRKIKL